MRTKILKFGIVPEIHSGVKLRIIKLRINTLHDTWPRRLWMIGYLWKYQSNSWTRSLSSSSVWEMSTPLEKSSSRTSNYTQQLKPSLQNPGWPERSKVVDSDVKRWVLHVCAKRRLNRSGFKLMSISANREGWFHRWSDERSWWFIDIIEGRLTEFKGWSSPINLLFCHLGWKISD